MKNRILMSVATVMIATTGLAPVAFAQADAGSPAVTEADQQVTKTTRKSEHKKLHKHAKKTHSKHHAKPTGDATKTSTAH